MTRAVRALIAWVAIDGHYVHLSATNLYVFLSAPAWSVMSKSQWSNILCTWFCFLLPKEKCRLVHKEFEFYIVPLNVVLLHAWLCCIKAAQNILVISKCQNLDIRCTEGWETVACFAFLGSAVWISIPSILKDMSLAECSSGVHQSPKDDTILVYDFNLYSSHKGTQLHIVSCFSFRGSPVQTRSCF